MVATGVSIPGLNYRIVAPYAMSAHAVRRPQEAHPRQGGAASSRRSSEIDTGCSSTDGNADGGAAWPSSTLCFVPRCSGGRNLAIRRAAEARRSISVAMRPVRSAARAGGARSRATPDRRDVVVAPALRAAPVRPPPGRLGNAEMMARHRRFPSPEEDIAVPSGATVRPRFAVDRAHPGTWWWRRGSGPDRQPVVAGTQRTRASTRDHLGRRRDGDP